jgi:uncharacterized membrane protein YgcG
MILRSLAFVFCLSIFANPLQAAPTFKIPEFTPNVVDPMHVLSSDEVIEINRHFQTIRDQAKILPAVYILDDLQDASIRDIAVEAFRR